MRTTPLLLLIAAALPAFSQTTPAFDVSGNAQLSGTYNFREVLYAVGSSTLGTLNESVSAYGTITFDGNGNYTLTGTQFDSAFGSPQALSFTNGTFGISASGFGFMSSPLSSGDTTYGLVSNGIFIGSSTESAYNDLIVAVPAGSASPTNASLNGSYWIADLDFPSSDPTQFRDALFQLNADGQGNGGTVDLTGYVAATGSAVVTQSAGVQYSFVNGAGTLSFPSGTVSSQTLVAGNKVLYVSPDGNLVFGGSATGWDLFVGVRSSSSGIAGSDFSGLYYQAGIDQDASSLSIGQSSISSYYGAINVNDGVFVAHQRVNQLTVPNAYDYTFDDTYTLNSDGSSTNAGQGALYQVGQGGLARVGIGVGPALGLNIALAAPTFSGSGVFLNPTGVVNAASSAPFTTGLAAGELITLYGTGMAPATAIASVVPFPNSIQGVQVLINGIAAPLYVVSPTQISAIVPYEISGIGVASIQVVNNGNASNTVTSYTSLTAPGAFTVPPGGIGYGAILHADYTLLTPSNPAQVGETLQVFVAGLGDVSPAVANGDVGPASPFSLTNNTIDVFIGGQIATVTYSGLAPGLAGLYQINVQVPSGISSGDVYLDISGPDSYNSQAVVSIASGTGTIGAASRTSRGRLAIGPRPAQRASGPGPVQRKGVR